MSLTMLAGRAFLVAGLASGLDRSRRDMRAPTPQIRAEVLALRHQLRVLEL